MKSTKNISKQRPQAAVPKKVAVVSPQLSSSDAAFSLDVKTYGLESVLGAAYLMMDKAYVSLSGDRAKSVVVTLRAKDPAAIKPKALAEEFLLDLASQKIRWAVAKNNLPIREFVAEQAVLIANGRVAPSSAAAAPPEPPAEQLTDDQRAEIEKLISEVEAEIKTMNDKKVVPDPKNIKASWEEKQEQENKA